MRTAYYDPILNRLRQSDSNPDNATGNNINENYENLQDHVDSLSAQLASQYLSKADARNTYLTSQTYAIERTAHPRLYVHENNLYIVCESGFLNPDIHTPRIARYLLSRRHYSDDDCSYHTSVRGWIVPKHLVAEQENYYYLPVFPSILIGIDKQEWIGYRFLPNDTADVDVFRLGIRDLSPDDDFLTQMIEANNRCFQIGNKDEILNLFKHKFGICIVNNYGFQITEYMPFKIRKVKEDVNNEIKLTRA